MAPLEIQALTRIIDELDYYQVLHLERSASPAEVKRAYYQSSRTFHPDSNRHLDDDMLEHCARIAKRLTEAYCVLRDPRKRRAYDEKIDGDDGEVRMQLSEAKTAHQKKQAETLHGRTPQGRQFYQKAIKEMERGQTAQAIQNLQMALTFEADNTHFKEKLEELRKRKG
jgi:DnaJ-class molecular chaperone